MRTPIAITTAAALLSSTCGCVSHHASYQRSRPAGGELVWTYHERFQIAQDGKIVAAQHDWDALSGTVACVPRARDWADTAASRDHTGRTLIWSGVGTMIAGVVGGGALILSDTGNSSRVLLGGSIALGSLAAGLAISLGGISLRSRADATAIDAINLYNDERASCTPAR